MKYIKKGTTDGKAVLEWCNDVDFKDCAEIGDAVKIHTNYIGLITGNITRVDDDRVTIKRNHIDTTILFSTIVSITFA